MLSRRNLLLIFSVLSLAWFATSIVVAGLFYPGYSHTTQFISELGATGAPYGAYVNYLGFIPTELFILGFVFVSHSVLPRTKKHSLGLILIAIYGLTLGIAAMFPCDFECRPDAPTLSHNIHMASAFPGYLCGILGIFFMSSGSASWAASKTFKSIGYFVATLALLAFLNLDPNSNTVGLNQRALEFLLYSWFIFFGYRLKKHLAFTPSHNNVF